MTGAFLLVIDPTSVELRLARGEALATAKVESVERRVDDLSWRLSQARRGGSSAEVAYRLRLLGEALGEAFCAEPIASALGRILDAGEPVRLGIRTDEPRLQDLPWEACVVPGRREPLSLAPAVEVYRAVHGGERGAAPSELGSSEDVSLLAPLRVLVLLAAPADGPPLDLDGEVERIQAALGSPIRRADCHIDVVSPGTVDGLRNALAAGPVHVVHLACHAIPGAAVFENDDGRAIAVRAEKLAVVLRGVPLVVLAGCHTAVSHDDLQSLAYGLVSSGTPAVLAMTAQISDGFSPRLAERFYLGLAVAEEPDPLTVLSTARRELEAERLAAADGDDIETVEWATPALFLNDLARPLYRLKDGCDTNVRTPPTIRATPVGRRDEILSLVAYLREHSPLIVYGIDGIGKTLLAEEVVRQLAGADRPVVRLEGHLKVADLHNVDLHAVLWCDGFDLNLKQTGLAEWEITDAALAARLAELPNTAVFASRYPFRYGHGNGTTIPHYQPALLTAPQITMLFFRLPALNALPAHDRETIALAIGGHPYALERLDSLVETGRDLSNALTNCVSEMAAHCGLTGLVEDLSPVARAMLAQVAVHRLPLPERAVNADHRSVLGELIANGVVVQQFTTTDGGSMLLSPRWIPVALAALLEDSTLRDAHRAAADYYENKLNTFHQTNRASTEWRTEVTLLREARHHHLGAGEVLYANASTNRLSHIYTAHSLWIDLDRLHEEQLAISEADSADAGAAHQSLASMAFDRGDVDGAATHAREALRIFERLDSPVKIAEAQHALATVDEQLGDDKSATQRCTAALAMVNDDEAPDLRGACFLLLGNIAARSDDPDCEDHYERALTHLSRSSSRDALHLIALVHTNRATLLARRGRHEEATAELRKALDTGGADADPVAARVLHDLALIAQAQHDYPRAQQYLREAVRIREAAGDRQGAAEHYHELGIVAMERGDLDGAVSYYRRVLLAARETGDRRYEGMAEHELALIAQRRGNAGLARELIEKAIELKTPGTAVDMASSYALFGQILREQGELAKALPALELAAVMSVKASNPEMIVNSYRELAELLLVLGRADEAEAALEKAIEAGRQRKLPKLLARDLGRLAQLRFDRSELAEAEPHYREMLGLATSCGDSDQAGQAHNQLGIIALARHELADAKVHFIAVLKTATELRDDYNVAGSHRNLGNVALFGGDPDTALDHFGRAQEVFRRIGSDEEADFAHREIGCAHWSRGDLEAAQTEMTRYRDARHAAGDANGRIDAQLQLAELEFSRDAPIGGVRLAYVALIEAATLDSPLTREAVKVMSRYHDVLGDKRLRSVLAELSDPETAKFTMELLDRFAVEANRP